MTTKGSGNSTIIWAAFSLLFLALALLKWWRFDKIGGMDHLLWIIALLCLVMAVSSKRKQLHQND